MHYFPFGVAIARRLGRGERRLEEAHLGVRIGDAEIRGQGAVSVECVRHGEHSARRQSAGDCKNVTWFWNVVRWASYAVGVRPLNSRNSWIKWAWSKYPQARASAAQSIGVWPPLCARATTA